MVEMLQPCLLLFLFHTSSVLLTRGQSDSSQNIETFYPFSIPPSSAPQPSFPNSNSPQITPSLPPTNFPLPLPVQPPPKSSSSSSNSKIAKAVAATAASTLVISGLVFFLIKKGIFDRHRRDQEGGGRSSLRGGGSIVVPHNESIRYDANLKGFIVDENGLDVLYWRNLDGKNSINGSYKESLQKNIRIEEKDLGHDEVKKQEPTQEIPLLLGNSSTSHIPEVNDLNRIRSSKTDGIALKTIQKPEPNKSNQSPTPPQPPSPPPVCEVANKNNHAPPPHAAVKKSPTPPPPPPPNTASLNSIPKPPQRPGTKPGKDSSSGEGRTEKGNNQVKLKPLHWDKLNKNGNHSMVWDKIDGGSFRFDGDTMEALFGYVATNRKSPKGNISTTNSIGSNTGLSAKTFILDTRKSQNVAIVLKSLSVPWQEIFDAVVEGEGISADTLEKLSRVAPTEEEKSQILEYNGDPTRLANAECFLYHILKVVPSAFARIDAMLFKSNYDTVISHLTESIQTLELACKELRTRGLFMKLLEAILKAGNRMNAGTSRGNAQAFNLTSLRKLSDVKSIDGKTTLLHFVVEEVVRSEGKRCVLNRSRTLSRNSSLNSESTIPKEEKEKEYIMLGLPMVGGLSSVFSNVKKAANLDYDNFTGTCLALTKQVTGIKQLVSHRVDDGEEGFTIEMKRFLEGAEVELKLVIDEQTRVMELVKKTTDYYQVGASTFKGSQPFQLFVIVRDFLIMVDQACVEIARHSQKKKRNARLGSLSPNSTPLRVPVRFSNFPKHFMSSTSSSSNSSESDND